MNEYAVPAALHKIAAHSFLNSNRVPLGAWLSTFYTYLLIPVRAVLLFSCYYHHNPHFINEETETQRGEETWTRSQSPQVSLGLKSRPQLRDCTHSQTHGEIPSCTRMHKHTHRGTQPRPQPRAPGHPLLPGSLTLRHGEAACRARGQAAAGEVGRSRVGSETGPPPFSPGNAAPCPQAPPALSGLWKSFLFQSPHSMQSCHKIMAPVIKDRCHWCTRPCAGLLTNSVTPGEVPQGPKVTQRHR